MNNNEQLEVLDALNDFLVSHDIKEEEYQFVYTQSPNGFSFTLEEIAVTGQSFLVFDSNEPLLEQLEEKWEKDEITYSKVIIETMRNNIGIHLKTLNTIDSVLRKI